MRAEWRNLLEYSALVKDAYESFCSMAGDFSTSHQQIRYRLFADASLEMTAEQTEFRIQNS